MAVTPTYFMMDCRTYTYITVTHTEHKILMTHVIPFSHDSADHQPFDITHSVPMPLFLC